MKLHFAYEGSLAEIIETGAYDAPIESSLPHRFDLVDGVVVDKYNGVSDDEVKRIDHEKAIADRLALIETLEEGQEVPAELPPLEIPSSGDDD